MEVVDLMMYKLQQLEEIANTQQVEQQELVVVGAEALELEQEAQVEQQVQQDLMDQHSILVEAGAVPMAELQLQAVMVVNLRQLQAVQAVQVTLA